MITITWYNMVAIFAGVLFIITFIYITRKDVGGGVLAELAKVFWILTLMVFIVVFYTVWGVIFWW